MSRDGKQHMEQKFKVDTPDGFKIHGRINSTSENQDKAVFIVHGMYGSLYEYSHKSAADYFEKDYDVYRFNFYSANGDARKLTNCTLDIQVSDLEKVLEEFAGKYKEVYVIGHSYGGMVIMRAKMPENVKCVTLWDPSFALDSFGELEEATAFGGQKFYLSPLSMHTLINEQMYKDLRSATRDYCLELAEKFTLPVQVVHGTRDLFGRYDESYSSRGHPDNIREYIENAKHNFANADHCKKLLGKTGSWFKRWQ